jgi:epoxide hydrolase 4
MTDFVLADAPGPWQHQYIQTNSVQLHCVTQGEGELVILLHGFPEFWYSWRFQIPALARHFKVVVPDLRGYNESDKPLTGYDLDTLSDDVRGLMRHFGYAKAHIVGHDWGGAIAWHFAQRFPEQLGRLAMLNAAHPQQFFQEALGNLDQMRRSWHLLALQVPGVPEWLIQQNLRQVVRNLFQGQAIRKSAFTREATERYEQALARPGALSGALNHYRQMLLPWNLMRSVSWGQAMITAPTLVLWGQDDFLLSQKLAEGLPRWVKAPLLFKRIPDCGHWIQQEAPQTVNRELLAFLRGEKAED